MAKIIVLEDDAATRRLISNVLTKSGHEVIDVDNGAEGLLIVLAEQPDLVVSDVEMPKLNGFEVLQQIRQDEYTAHTPVILLTSLTSQADIQQGISQGANDYLTKPFQPQILLQSVERVLSGGGASGTAETMPAGLDDQATMPAALDWRPYDSATQPMQLAHAVRNLGNAWALNLQVMNAPMVQRVLPAKSWRLLLRQLFASVNKDAAMRQADFLDLQEASLTLYFLDSAPAIAAVVADALEAMVQTAARGQQWALEQLPEVAAMPPRIVMSLHRGPIEVQRVPLDYGGERDAVIGETAQLITRLRQGSPALAWRVMGTASAVQAAKQAYRLGAQMEVSVGSQEMLVHALMGRREALSIGDEGSKSASANWV